MVFINEWPTQHVNDARTVDHERNAVLKCEGGGGAAPEDEMSLFWNDISIRFVGRWDTTSEPDGKSGIDWKILLLRIPKTHRELTEEIKKLIYEAIAAYGYLYKRDNISRTTVTFSPKIMYY